MSSKIFVLKNSLHTVPNAKTETKKKKKKTMAVAVAVANPNAASVPPPPDYDVEFRSLADDAWYSVCTVLDGEKLTIKYQNFSDDDDSIFEVKNFKTLEELESLKDRFRPISAQLQDNECHKVVRGVVVCASHSFDGSDNRFYDAVVDDVSLLLIF